MQRIRYVMSRIFIDEYPISIKLDSSNFYAQMGNDNDGEYKGVKVIGNSIITRHAIANDIL